MMSNSWEVESKKKAARKQKNMIPSCFDYGIMTWYNTNPTTDFVMNRALNALFFPNGK